MRIAIPVIHLCQRGGPDRKAQFTTFGVIEIAGQRYDHDRVIDGGKIRKRSKKASKVYREMYGHTPLSLGENLLWGGRPLIVGTGRYGRLPVLPDGQQEAAWRKIEDVVVPTEETCRLLADQKDKDVYAMLHGTG